MTDDGHRASEPSAAVLAPIDIPDDFALVEDAYEEVFSLYTEGDPSSWLHNRAVSQKVGSVEVELEVNGHPKTLTLHQNLSLLSHRGTTGAVLWDSSILLSRLLLTNPHLLPLSRTHTRILELGSGCGLLGIALAPLVAHVTLTDQPGLLSLLLKNVRRNLPPVFDVQVAELLWGRPLDRELATRTWDLIVASDCVYNEHVVPALVGTLGEVCRASDAVRRREMAEGVMQARGGKTVVVLAQELRSDTVHLAFLEEWMAAGFVVWRVGGGRLGEFKRGYVVYVAWLG